MGEQSQQGQSSQAAPLNAANLEKNSKALEEEEEDWNTTDSDEESRKSRPAYLRFFP